MCEFRNVAVGCWRPLPAGAFEACTRSTQDYCGESKGCLSTYGGGEIYRMEGRADGTRARLLRDVAVSRRALAYVGHVMRAWLSLVASWVTSLLRRDVSGCRLRATAFAASSYRRSRASGCGLLRRRSPRRGGLPREASRRDHGRLAAFGAPRRAAIAQTPLTPRRQPPRGYDERCSTATHRRSTID
jgi:hypothetical protein